MRLKPSALICSAVVLVFSLALYLRTLAPTVTLVDSGELIVAARTLGVGHPPGFPLYVLLTHLIALFPFGSIAWRVNFASALFAALAAATIAVVVSKAGEQVPNGAEFPPRFRLVVAVLPPLVAGFLLAFSRTLWAYATVTEVYALNAFLTSMVFVLMFLWRKPVPGQPAGQAAHSAGPESLSQPPAQQSEDPATGGRDRILYVASFLFGLAMGVHHVTVAITLPALAALVLFSEGIGFFKSKRLLYAFLISLSGLAIYAYLPIAAHHPRVLNWGDPRTLERLWWHVSGRQYQAYLSFSPVRVGRLWQEFLRYAGREFGPWWQPVPLLLAAAGLVFAFRRDRAMFWFLLLLGGADLMYGLSYEIAEDKDAYYLPLFFAMAIAAGLGARWFLWVFSRPPSAGLAFGAAASVLVLAPLGALAANFPHNDRSRFFIAQDYVSNIFSTIGPGGMLLTGDWQVYSPVLYTQEIEQRRRDVVVIDVNLLRRSWYYSYLHRAYPGLMGQTGDKVNEFLQDLERWEHDPKTYERDPALSEQINSRFQGMILAMIASHSRGAPVYVTADLGTSPGRSDPELTKQLLIPYQLVPQGLVYQLVSDRFFHEPAEVNFQTRGLADGTVLLESDDVVELKVLPVYLEMFLIRGRYLADHGEHGRAIWAYQQALKLAPDFQPARQSVAASLRALRDSRETRTR